MKIKYTLQGIGIIALYFTFNEMSIACINYIEQLEYPTIIYWIIGIVMCIANIMALYLGLKYIDMIKKEYRDKKVV
jgi:hypothetical protein